MKKFFWLGMVWLIGMVGLTHAATRGDVRVLEATDSIRYNTSKMAKGYLLYLLYPQKKDLKLSLQSPLDDLNEAMHVIAISTKDAKSKGVLKYFAYEKVHVDTLIRQKPSKQSARDILDFSESFAEGAAAIAHRHQYTPTPEEEMWMTTRSMKEDLEEIIKYYLARDVIKSDTELQRKMDKAVEHFVLSLKRINAYDYDDDLTKTRHKINVLWNVFQTYLAKLDTVPLPLISTLMGDELASSINLLSLYHSTNQ